MKILIIDDDRRVGQYLVDSLTPLDHDVLAATGGGEGVALFESWSPELVVVDLKMQGLDGMGVIEKIRVLDPEASIVMMTAYASVETAVKAMRRGAIDYITKPFDAAQIDMIAKNILAKRRLDEISFSADRIEGIIGTSAAIGKVHDLIHKVARSDVTVLIQGESGTGKELAARAIHRESARADRTFVAVDCGALSESLLESELFGHKKGAFTGAHADRIGLIRSAENGTIFLDEVANLSPGLQAKFLRVLEERKVRPVGGDESYPVDVRVIAATNRNLRWDVEEGAFRKDLYYRLDVVSMYIPPLRERPEDIPLLIEHFLRGEAKSFDQEVLDLLASYKWPGNIRELENVIEHVRTVSSGPLVGIADLPGRLGELASTPKESYKAARREFDRTFIEALLMRNRGNVSESAKEMGISRRSLHEKMKDLGIHSRDFKKEE